MIYIVSSYILVYLITMWAINDIDEANLDIIAVFLTLIGAPVALPLLVLVILGALILALIWAIWDGIKWAVK